MGWAGAITARLERRLEAFRLAVARSDAIAELCLLGVLTGVLAAAVIILFRKLIEVAQLGLIGDPLPGYGALAPWQRLGLLVAGGLLLGVLLQALPAGLRRVGVVHLLERLDYRQGRLPWGNALWQFLGGALALISGQSVGREGPSIHLGAAAGNCPAQWLGLPNNALRVVATCGAAAGIAATFNTPLAGVAFALEVLLMETSVAAFAPVILATVSATALTRLAFGDDLAFTVPALELGSLAELPLALLLGVGLGLVAAAFVHGLTGVQRRAEGLPLWSRPTLAGLAVGLIALWIPEVMGIGYDTVNLALQGGMALWLLAALVFAKWLATVLAVGLGVPGGLIGPALVIGATGGGLFAGLAQAAGLIPGASVGFHVLLGMGAMMAAVLQAPLAALLAILELTGNPNVLFPGMLAVVAATLTAGALHRRESVFQAMLRNGGLDHRHDRISRLLRQVGVAAVMDRDFIELPALAGRAEISRQLADTPHWVLIRPAPGTAQLLPAIDLARALEAEPDAREFDLLEIPGARLDAADIDFQATLLEADERLYQRGAQGLYVTRLTVPGLPRVYGVLTRQEIERGYRQA